MRGPTRQSFVGISINLDRILKGPGLPGRQARDRRPVGANPKQQLAGNLLLRMKTLLATSWPPTMPPGH
jgi:hypothetical protein